MKITRHPVDVENVADTFRREVPHFDHLLSMVAIRVDNLYIIFSSGRVLAASGSVVAPEAPEVARALRLAARTGAGAFAFARAEYRPEALTLEEGLSVSYSQATDESLVDHLTWRRALYLTAIARQPDMTAELCRLPTDLLRRSSTGPINRQGLGYRFIDLLRDVWTKPNFTQYPAFIEWMTFATSGKGGTAPNDNVRCISGPFLRVLQQLEQNDPGGFRAALIEALQGHKEYWSSTEQLRKDFEGFVSLPLTAVAALAWDRGLRFEVESDYLPWSWVTGEIFAANR